MSSVRIVNADELRANVRFEDLWAMFSRYSLARQWSAPFLYSRLHN